MEAWREVRGIQRGLLTREEKLAAEIQRLYLRSEKLLQTRLKDLNAELVLAQPGEEIGLFFQRERVVSFLAQTEQVISHALTSRAIITVMCAVI